MPFYDLIETNKEMVLFVVKEQLNHYRIKRMANNEYISHLACRKAHESQFTYIEHLCGSINFGDCWVAN
jgi:hypothetical protein